ncbi:MAG: bifunctional pantoate--beta-alanine ligase/(d)CMP kinase [Cyanobacteriota bacterium]|nr:bifunctional pantoate--beta-alanine ligase/(d)CMP kinase [Cyanobacteriota bacterium]
MRLIQSVGELRERLAKERGRTLGLVPTMGSLHQGHHSLIQRAQQESDTTVVSIFVNPLQFGPQEDFSRYPRQLEADLEQCQALQVDIVFAPEVEEILGKRGQGLEQRTQVVPPAYLLQHLCGPFRPGHFEGVLTIVLQLFHLVQPQRAYFGQKDAQQWVVIRRMVEDLALPITVISCPIVREADGLAMSSRNQYLDAQQRQLAAQIYQALRQGQAHFCEGDPSAAGILEAVKAALQPFPQIRLQYLQLVDPQHLQPLERMTHTGLLAIAAFIGTTRLIDNLMLSLTSHEDPLHLVQPSQPPVEPTLSPPLELAPPEWIPPTRKPLIAIDGPAGAGKSTVARRVAAELNLLYLDTGAMYRAITWLALQKGIPLDDEAQLTQLANKAHIRLTMSSNLTDPPQVSVNGEDVTTAIRSQEISRQVSAVAAMAGVRQALVRQQREIGRDGAAVLEGRDIGTYVFPQAELKIFLTASVKERAQRRQLELSARGEDIDLEALQQQINERDRYDSERPFAPLQQAPDAIVISTDHLNQEQVQAEIVKLYQDLLNRQN